MTDLRHHSIASSLDHLAGAQERRSRHHAVRELAGVDRAAEVTPRIQGAVAMVLFPVRPTGEGCTRGLFTLFASDHGATLPRVFWALHGSLGRRSIVAPVDSK